MRPIPVTVPKFIGSEYFFRKNKPCCAVGYVLEATLKRIPYPFSGKKEATDDCNGFWSNEGVDSLAEYLHETYGYREELLQESLGDLAIANDETKSQAKRRELLTSFIKKFPKAYVITEQYKKKKKK